MNKVSQELPTEHFHWHLLCGMEKYFLCLQVLAVLGLWVWGTNVLWTFCGACISAILILLSFGDIRYGLLYDELNLTLAIMSILYVLLVTNSLSAAVTGLLVGAGSLFLLRIATYGGIGIGDIKLAGAIGICLGGRLTLVMLFIAFLLGGLVAIVLLLTGKVQRGTKLPFGPFLAFSSYIAFVFGATIWQWYEGWL